jgi:hypothetical protein
VRASTIAKFNTHPNFTTQSQFAVIEHKEVSSLWLDGKGLNNLGQLDTLRDRVDHPSEEGCTRLRKQLGRIGKSASRNRESVDCRDGIKRNTHAFMVLFLSLLKMRKSELVVLL